MKPVKFHLAVFVAAHGTIEQTEDEQGPGAVVSFHEGQPTQRFSVQLDVETPLSQDEQNHIACIILHQMFSASKAAVGRVIGATEEVDVSALRKPGGLPQ